MALLEMVSSITYDFGKVLHITLRLATRDQHLSNLSMQLTQQLGLMALASTASAFVVDVFSGERCTGQSQNVNVYDNTCAAWMIGYRSFRVKTWWAVRLLVSCSAAR
ncbi:uncharacterized protein VDAG_07236 [Verticillium dahliae VdLs.17]|uniref:Uncharacterized protein n=1 Tax=Verticillium dahliae (strain VdLs.17 / ATCC MYA-4575 / FGSC 10137) TaxID=498257 RepID=G2XB98_VERDV|nr:uncharacterized protein VDAG_07236 [Verticillium dahliae VdLs.17]EGY16072.1 hypothetical protein VDAG_07236 [Verticillium dahliae VdLs.17]KAH6687032.1 hypothetical protein EV126DRAFT_349944 [Verticillium dahliae]